MAGGVILVIATLISLAAANSPWGATYTEIMHASPLHAVINDVLMTFFFLTAGAEIKRELVGGELSTWRRASLPLVAALGGMVAPAVVYLLVAPDGGARRGWAIPTATDIAFALGCLTLVKERVPRSLFVFLTALAIFDDLGAILIIAFVYGTTTHVASLALALAVAAIHFAFARRLLERPILHVVVSITLWIAIARSGLHPTLAGVVVGLAMPPRDERVERFVRGLHVPVTFGVLPLFALANAGVALGGGPPINGRVALAVGAGLLVGKLVGVLGSIAIAVRVGLAPLPTNASWRHVTGVALFAGIGFTMSIFVTELAFADAPASATASKIGVLGGSLVSALLGATVLFMRSLARSGPTQGTL